MKTIIVDMMGGDKAPAETVKGVALAAKEFDAKYILVGIKDELLAAADANNISLDDFEIVDTPTVITMDDDPISVTRSKSDSSMSVALRMLAESKGDAVVSTGNTGALFTGSTLIVRKMKNLRRPAIAALLPMQPPVLLLDSGANISVTPEYLEQFAVMGSAYMKYIHGLENPRVGLLNNGEEEHKGTQLQVDTYKLLRENEDINFVGNVEGNRVMSNVCDVLVADGFTGNIFLKTMEGMGKLMLKTLKGIFYTNTKTKVCALMVQHQIKDVKKKFDTREFGGAPILGISKPVIKAHGSSDAKAFKNAIRQAIAFSEADLTSDMEATLASLAERKKAQKKADE
ncbi:MAG: phosphate acyltransferase PlsX [Ruminococcaceae bacterium]|nr:phosphate acyltransferase PlsX [Oscillospiraceae bacterium]